MLGLCDGPLPFFTIEGRRFGEYEGKVAYLDSYSPDEWARSAGAPIVGGAFTVWGSYTPIGGSCGEAFIDLNGDARWQPEEPRWNGFDGHVSAPRAGPAAAPRCVARGHLVTCTLEAADFKPLPSVFP